MQEITHTVTEQSGKVTNTKKPWRKHREAFEITDKTPKGQIPVIEGWNEMRQDCIDNGIMEPK
jgi:hypothetical protein